VPNQVNSLRRFVQEIQPTYSKKPYLSVFLRLPLGGSAAFGAFEPSDLRAPGKLAANSSIPMINWVREVAGGIASLDQNNASNGHTSMQMPHHIH